MQVYLTRDKDANLRFASLQSDLARELLPAAGIDPDDMSSMVFLEDGKAYLRSEGALRAGSYLSGFLGPLSKALRILPVGLRDFVYRIIARNRYRWFGKQESCMLPRPEWKARFLG